MKVPDNSGFEMAMVKPNLCIPFMRAVFWGYTPIVSGLCVLYGEVDIQVHNVAILKFQLCKLLFF